MGHADLGGLGWSPREFWDATPYDMHRALGLARRRSNLPTREEADAMKLRLHEQRQREADERAARGDHRTTTEIIAELTERILSQGKV